MQTKFMVKYGKKEHLQQIIDGKIRFTPSQNYINIEETQKISGQGDRLEGKMVMPAGNIDINNIYKLYNIITEATFQDVKRMLISCFASYDEGCTCERINNEIYKILLPDRILNCIKNDFPDATHALIILEPDKFIQGVCDITGHKIVGDTVKYFERDSTEKYLYLANGHTAIMTGSFKCQIKDKYRILLTKEKNFENQCEYRFICIDYMGTDPVEFSCKFSSKYMLVSIDELQNKIEINLNTRSL